MPKEETVNAYAQFGSLYRLRDQFTESEKIIMEGMQRFWDVGLLKVFYAFTMYDLGNTEKAMRWMTHALLDFSRDPETFLNQRVISYLGSNSDVQHIMENFVVNVPNEVDRSKVRKSIVAK